MSKSMAAACLRGYLLSPCLSASYPELGLNTLVGGLK